MNLKSKIPGIVFLVTSIFTGLQAQQIHNTINSSDGNASGSGGNLSYSIGQVFYTTITGTDGSVASGMQQAYEISELNTSSEYRNSELSVSAYPNPANDFLNLKIGFSALNTFGKFLYEIYDINGKLLEQKIISGLENEVDMRTYTPGTYFIRVSNSAVDNQLGMSSTTQPEKSRFHLAKTFKIIKNQIR